MRFRPSLNTDGRLLRRRQMTREREAPILMATRGDRDGGVGIIKVPLSLLALPSRLMLSVVTWSASIFRMHK